MTEEQADNIISLLERILERLEYIESNTGDISYVKSNTDDIARSIDRIRRNM